MVELAQPETGDEALVIKLGRALVLGELAETRQMLIAALARRSPLHVDAAAVEEIDTAGIQVLCAFCKDASTQRQQVLWTAVSTRIEQATEALGVRALLHRSERR